jgi:SAM-dependent methyltransferase
MWLLLNWANNTWLPNHIIDDSLIIRNFSAGISEADWNRLDVKSSPSRKLSDLFWLKFPWASAKSELGEIKILDTGCGSGNYGVKLQSYSGESITSYTGIDIYKHKNWDDLAAKYANFRFCRIDSKNILDCIPQGSNFFMTQSAVEHFEQDLTFFEQIRKFILRSSQSVVQVHLLPSSICLKQYLFHGIRQYTPRTISRITRIFRDFSYSVLFRLGGRQCNVLHWEYITKPLVIQKKIDTRESRTRQYEQRLTEAIKADMENPSGTAGFYALVIHSNWKKKIF